MGNFKTTLAVGAALACVICAAACSSGRGASSERAVQQAEPLAALQQDTGVSWEMIGRYLHPKGIPNASFLSSGTRPEDGAMEFLVKYGGALGLNDARAELTLIRPISQGEWGIVGAVFAQQVHGIPVDTATISVLFDAMGRPRLVSTGYVAAIRELPTTASLNPSAVIILAQRDIAQRVPEITSMSLSEVESPELVFHVEQQSAVLAYRLNLHYVRDDVHILRQYIVNANSGAIVSTVDPVEKDSPCGQGQLQTETGIGRLNDTKSFPALRHITTRIADDYMQNYWSAGGVTAPQPLFASSYSGGACILKATSSSAWSTVRLGSNDPEAVDAYAYINTAANWWSNHGRTSYDNNGGLIDVQLHVPSLPNGAGFGAGNPALIMVGDASPANGVSNPFPASTGLDMMAHEYAHAVASKTLAPCQGAAEGCSVSESIGDVFGQFAEADVPASSLPYTPVVTTEGEARVGPNSTQDPWLRNLAHPHLSGENMEPDYPNGQPDNIHDPLYTGSEPHMLDGVPNNAWYLATYSGSNDTSKLPVLGVDALGLSVSEKIYAAAVLDLGQLGTTSPLHTFAQGLVEMAAFGIWGDPVQNKINAIACAYYAVGVFSPEEIKNTWNVTDCQCHGVNDSSYCGSTVPTFVHNASTVIGSANTLYTCSGGVLKNVQVCSGTCYRHHGSGMDSCSQQSTYVYPPPGPNGPSTPGTCNGCQSNADCGNDGICTIATGCCTGTSGQACAPTPGPSCWWWNRSAQNWEWVGCVNDTPWQYCASDQSCVLEPPNNATCCGGAAGATCP